MFAEAARNLHVTSSRVILDGAAVRAAIEIDRGRVVSIAPGSSHGVDLDDRILAPAPLDVHIHGCGGVVVPPAGSPLDLDDALMRALDSAPEFVDPRARSLGLEPRVEWLATLPVPSQPPVDQVSHVAEAAHAIAVAGADCGCLGIRLEGCFLNPARAGIWPQASFAAPDPALLDALADAAAAGGSRLCVVDVAPELPGALRLIERAVERGIVVSLAHTDANWDEARAAIEAGATLATHTWNAMRPLAHRDPGVVAAVLADPRVTCELICDGVHLHPGTIDLTIAACGSGRWAIISDASPLAGLPPGDYEWAGTVVTHDGAALRDSQGTLAGSALLLPAAFEVLAQCDRPDDVARAIAASATPRRVLDPARSLGIEVGDLLWIAPSAADGHHGS